MSYGVEQTHRLAELTLGALKKLGLSATARNYELWYCHIEGRNPALSRDVQIATDAFGKITQDNADALYRVHLQQGKHSNSVLDLISRFNAEVADLHEIIEKSGASASGNNETLDDLSGQLRQTTEDYPAVGALLEGVFSVAKDMRIQNEQLETRLAESASEINTLQENVEYIEAEAMKDPLTGVFNRARFDKAIIRMCADSLALDKPLSLLFADIDFFKSFNDNYGHQTGDQVLRLVAEVMEGNIRSGDILARYGGEEFAVLLPGANLENASILAERIRTAVEGRKLKKRRSNEDLGSITMSVGVANFKPSDTIESFIERADKCLYAAKDLGRNQIVHEDQNIPPAAERAEAKKSGTA